MMGIKDRPDSRGSDLMMGIKDRPDSRGSDLDIDDSRSDRDSRDIHDRDHDIHDRDHDIHDRDHDIHDRDHDIHDRDHDDHDREPISSSERPPMPKLKMGALDIANMIAKHKPKTSSPVGGVEHRTAMAQISPLSTVVKPLDLSHYSRLPTMPPGFKGGFYPYPGVSLPPTLSAYPYNPEAVSLSAAAPTHGAQSLPMYSYPLTETAGTPSMSTLRLSALLASRKRRQGGSTSEDSHDPDLDLDDKMASGDASSRKKVRPVPEEKKDGAYWERRRKNNDAAKRSRDARRMKEEEIALRAVFLEQENMKLRAECSILKSELGRLHFMVYNC